MLAGADDAGAALGSGRLRNLRVLDLRGNGITSVGLCFLIEALRQGQQQQRPRHEEEEEDGEGEDRRRSRGEEAAVKESPCPHLEEMLLGFNYIGEGGEGRERASRPRAYACLS